MVRTVPFSDHLQEPVVPVVAALTGVPNSIAQIKADIAKRNTAVILLFIRFILFLRLIYVESGGKLDLNFQSVIFGFWLCFVFYPKA